MSDNRIQIWALVSKTCMLAQFLGTIFEYEARVHEHPGDGCFDGVLGDHLDYLKQIPLRMPFSQTVFFVGS